MKVVILILSILKFSLGFETHFGACPTFEPLAADKLDETLLGKW